MYAAFKEAMGEDALVQFEEHGCNIVGEGF
jgi:hypothetical protein